MKIAQPVNMAIVLIPRMDGKKIMDKFHTMEEFLIRCSSQLEGYPCRFVHLHMDGEGWVKYYNTAKSSWEKYGDVGPPVGCKVQTLISGFGGGSGLIRRIVEVKDSSFKNDESCMSFMLGQYSSHFDPMTDGNLYISLIKDWYLDFKVLGEPNGI